MAYIEVVKPNGDIGIGSAFHIGDGILVTARHVVENCEITKIGTTESYNVPDDNGNVYIHNVEGRFRAVAPQELTMLAGPYYHPDSSIDVAALITKPNDCKTAFLGLYVDNWIHDSDYLLKKTVILGYPPIPFSKEPKLFAASAEINSIIKKYVGKHIHYIISAMPRGGFSGGLCLLDVSIRASTSSPTLATAISLSQTNIGYDKKGQCIPDAQIGEGIQGLRSEPKGICGGTWTVGWQNALLGLQTGTGRTIGPAIYSSKEGLCRHLGNTGT